MLPIATPVTSGSLGEFSCVAISWMGCAMLVVPLRVLTHSYESVCKLPESFIALFDSAVNRWPSLALFIPLGQVIPALPLKHL